jgi:LPS-assembly protein
MTASAQQVATPLPNDPIPPGNWDLSYDRQEIEGKVHRLYGIPGRPAQVRDSRALFRAQEIEWDQDTGDVHAQGEVYYHSFEKSYEFWASRMEYNTEEKTGKFFDVRGETRTGGVVRPGVLVSNNPLHFEGEWLERDGEKFVLHNGWITNCALPVPWWRLKGPRFDIIPEERAISYRSEFLLRGVPLFYAPVFRVSLEKQPRKSGFLTPNIGNSTRRGAMVGAGYFWAINRWADATYRVQDFTARGLTHHLDFRAKPREDADFDAVLYGVQDRGNGEDPPQKFSGISLYAVGHANLGDGWSAHGSLNYISSFRFRQEWTESYNEAVLFEFHSVGYVNKNWSNYSFNLVFSRLQNFQSTEIPVYDAKGNVSSYESNAVTVRKLPEVEFNGTDRQISKKIPLWFSTQATAGLLYRSAPVFEGNTLVDRYETGQFMNRVHFAPHLTSALHLGDFHLVPSIGVNETYYSEAQTPSGNHYTVTGTNLVSSARDLSLDFVFPSLARVFNKKTVFGDKLKHVIEPRATYRYVTGIGTDFNKFIRFDETDLVANTNELELSLTNRIYAKRGDRVDEIFTWELIQKRYFDPTFGGALIPGTRNVFDSTANLTAYAFLVGPRSTSPVVSRLRISPFGGLGVQWEADYDHRVGRIVDSALQIDYRWKSKYFVSAGNNEVHNDPLLAPAANQYRFRAGFGDSTRRGWNAVGEAVYDYRAGEMQYWSSQVTYNTDCCGLSVQYRQIGIRNDGLVRIAFTIANFGSFGTLRKQDRMF